MEVETLPTLSPREAVRICFRKYCNFSGRARRSEFWFLALFVSIMMSVLSTIFYIHFLRLESHYKKYYNYKTGRYEYYGDTSGLSRYLIFVLVFMSIIGLLYLFPLISAGVRRLHDTGKSGCYYFFILIPLLDLLLLLFLADDSEQNENEYGSSPKYILIQNAPLTNNNPEIIPVNEMPDPNSQISQEHPQDNPDQHNPQNTQYPQNPQSPIQNDLYQGPIQANPSNQEEIATPVVAP